MWCNLVDVKCKQGFLECKHAALNIWKAVPAVGLSWAMLGPVLLSGSSWGGPHCERVCFGLLVTLLTEWFVWGWRGCFPNSTGLQLPGRVVTFILVLTARFGSLYVCVAAMCIGWIPWAFTVPAECNRIPSCHLCLRSHVGDCPCCFSNHDGAIHNPLQIYTEAHQ